MTRTRINAYVLLSESAWVHQSVKSYYSLIDRLIVCYDRERLGWTGLPIEIDDALESIRRLDVEQKHILLEGDFAGDGSDPISCDTRQRQVALDAASEGAAWVLQLDTDEIVLDLDSFTHSLRECETHGRSGLEFPSRMVYADLGNGRFLEVSDRWRRPAATYPGPLAVAAGTALTLSRRGPSIESLWRVDFAPTSTDPGAPRTKRVDAVITPDEAVAHMSWVRDSAGLRAKARSSGHANDFDWSREIRRWEWSQRFPRLAVAMTPLRSWGVMRWLRVSSIAGVDT